MAKEILAIPEDRLLEVIAVIRSGLDNVQVTSETRERLQEWCDKEYDYITTI